MDRSLDPELLDLALGKHDALPSPEELSSLLANSELALLLRDHSVPEQLIATGWYLHGIASSKYALRTYGVERHRAAFQVAAHIFDLVLQTPDISDIEKFKYCFAAQIAYARSSLDPNALALYRRAYSEGLNNPNLLPDFQLVSLSCGIAFLGFDVSYIYQLTGIIEKEINALTASWGLNNIEVTIYGAAANVSSGTKDLMSFLVYGRADLLERARVKFRTAITANASREDELSRWVAAHLLNFSDHLEHSTIWNVLPPDVPTNVRKAFVHGKPRILTLWPPQIDFLGVESTNNPLSLNVKRLLLSTPTSGGKTLAAQLLITTHLAVNRTSVCYVAPTRSLCREIRESLQSRLRFIDKQIVDGLPEGAWLDIILDVMRPEVEVMTPERLSYLIRTDSNQVLEKFGMFIFDEVHLVDDKSRGWILEENLSFLHYATENLYHKIALISAAIGNRNHIIQWLDGENLTTKPLEFHSDWRGPRRIHAIWTTDALWDATITERNDQAKKYFYNRITPLYGRLDVRISHTGLAHTFHTNTPVGELVRRAEEEYGRFERDSSKCTPFYKMLVPIIDYLSEFGPVLIIESTKPNTIRLAEAISEEKEPIDRQQIVPLIDLVSTRLGVEHPLTRTLEKGVAYHHGSLPSEIRNAIEEAVSSGYLRYIVATTTLTEGINLPVTSVVIASQGSYGQDGYSEYITGAKLVNAIGRAGTGRATKETEGIVILARQAQPDADDFDRLDPNENDLQVKSQLATEEALKALAIFEELYRVSEDAVFEASIGAVSDFLKFVWFLSSEFERRNGTVQIEQIQEVLSQTLGWVQLDPEDRSRWLQAATITLNQYQSIEKTVRRRWASSGTSINSSRIIEQIVQSLVSDIEEGEFPRGTIIIVEFILSNNRLQQILQLPEAPKQNVFHRRTGRNRREIDVSTDRILVDWLGGMSLIDISEQYFMGVNDIDFRFEQLGNFINSRFEVFFPWVFGTIISWVNDLLNQRGVENSLPTSLPANIRYGVGDPVSLELMVRGIQSRQLAIKISEVWHDYKITENVVSWIRSLSLAQWIDMFSALPSEIRNLLEISRMERGGIAVNLFNAEQVDLNINANQNDYPSTEVDLRKIDGSEFSQIGVWDKDILVGTIFSRDQSDIASLMHTGLSLSIEYIATSGNGILTLHLVEPD